MLITARIFSTFIIIMKLACVAGGFVGERARVSGEPARGMGRWNKRGNLVKFHFRPCDSSHKLFIDLHG